MQEGKTVKIKPILFNTEMVQAILAGQKTQTRRLVRKKYSNTDIVMHTDKYGTHFVERQNDIPLPVKHADGTMTGQLVAMCEIPFPFHRGDVLWVRETWLENKNPKSETFGGYEYRADYDGAMCQTLIRWHPSIHMPKEAARIFLRVKVVRVERVRDITDDDALREGVQYTDFVMYTPDWEMSIDGGKRPGYHVGRVTDSNQYLPTARSAYAKLWNSTIKKADLPCYGCDFANHWEWRGPVDDAGHKEV